MPTDPALFCPNCGAALVARGVSHTGQPGDQWECRCGWVEGMPVCATLPLPPLVRVRVLYWEGEDYDD